MLDDFDHWWKTRKLLEADEQWRELQDRIWHYENFDLPRAPDGRVYGKRSNLWVEIAESGDPCPLSGLVASRLLDRQLSAGRVLPSRMFQMGMQPDVAEPQWTDL